MRIGLYTHLENSPGNTLLLEESRKRGLDMTLVRPRDLDLNLNIKSSEFDLIMARTGASAPEDALVKLAILEVNVPCINSWSSFMKTRNKALQYALLQAAGVPIPTTILLSRSEFEGFESALPSAPWILKLPVSTKGQGVCLVESPRSLRSTLDCLLSRHSSVLLQEFVSEAKGSDIRVMVLGGKAILAAQRQASSPEEFRSNVHLGGRATIVRLTEEMSNLAESAAKVLGLEIAGVDLLKGEEGYLVVEVNASPGLTASPDLAKQVINYVETIYPGPRLNSEATHRPQT